MELFYIILGAGLALGALKVFRSEVTRIANSVVEEETRWVADEFDRQRRSIDKLADKPELGRLSAKFRRTLKAL